MVRQTCDLNAEATAQVLMNLALIPCEFIRIHSRCVCKKVFRRVYVNRFKTKEYGGEI